MPRKVYWDACVFIGLINREVGKYDDIRLVWDEASRGETLIVTSALTYAEVFKARCEGKVKPLAEKDDEPVREILSQKWVSYWVLDESLATDARRLLRAYPECSKPTDGVHLATALRSNVDEMHTYDNSDLIKISGRCRRADGNPLAICVPKVIAKAEPMPAAPAGQQVLDFGQ